MAKLKLTYLDFHGGRGEPARLALSIAGIAFEDDRVKFADWPARKPNTLFGHLPILEVDGQAVSQSNTINRYVGKLSDLYPSDPWQAAICDEVMDAVEEIGEKTGATLYLPDEQKKEQRKALADGAITRTLRALEQRLVSQGGQFFAGQRLSMADLRTFVWVRYLKSGQLEHVPSDLPDRVAPRLVEHFERIKSHAGVKAYYAKHGIG